MRLKPFFILENLTMKKDKDVFYTTKNNKVAHFDPNKQNKTKNAKPWEAMNRNGKILKKTIQFQKMHILKKNQNMKKDIKKNINLMKLNLLNLLKNLQVKK